MGGTASTWTSESEWRCDLRLAIELTLGPVHQRAGLLAELLVQLRRRRVSAHSEARTEDLPHLLQHGEAAPAFRLPASLAHTCLCRRPAASLATTTRAPRRHMPSSPRSASIRWQARLCTCCRRRSFPSIRCVAPLRHISLMADTATRSRLVSPARSPLCGHSTGTARRRTRRAAAERACSRLMTDKGACAVHRFGDAERRALHQKLAPAQRFRERAAQDRSLAHR